MEVTSATMSSKVQYAPTEESFRNFLRWLDDGAANSDGESYLKMRRRLVTYFDRKGCTAPGDLADETLSRVARRLDEEGHIETETPAKFCYTIARYVFLEQTRVVSREIPLDTASERAPHSAASFVIDDDSDEHERLLERLDECLAKLDLATREMLFRYYRGEQSIKIENRRALATELGVSMNALSIRVFRVREKLEACLRKRAERQK